MKLSLQSQLPKVGKKTTKKNAKSASSCLVVLVNKEQQILAEHLSKTQHEKLCQLIELSQFKGKAGDVQVDFALHQEDMMPVVLVGIGEVSKLTINTLQKIAKTINTSIKSCFEKAYLLFPSQLSEVIFEQFALALLNANYQFDKYKSKSGSNRLIELVIVSEEKYQAQLDFVQSVYLGQSLARDVANEPGNVIYPETMAEQAKQLAKTYGNVLKVSVIDEKKMAKLGMNCFLAVSQGSSREGKLVVLEYQGKSAFNKASAEDAPIALVGKGVTFDTGGICLKPAAGMEEMKFDMGGAASVLGTIKALCESQLPINVVGLLACAENMPSGDATRPGDIVTAMNGKTVEIINTDAEGRLVLADTLCYAQRYQPKAIIDVATLTGACVIALGHVRSAVYSNDEDVLFALENASELSGDWVWHMPLDDEYQNLIDSNIADIQNIGGRGAGSVTAACFLSRFIEEGQAWAHLDVAGTAWQSGKDKNATGRPVPLFMYYLKTLVDKKTS